MYALIANGYKCIVESKETLDVLASIYPYPKWGYFRTYEEACNFLDRYKRGDYGERIRNYGDTDKFFGYCNITYIISNDNLYCTVDTSKVGFITIDTNKMKDVSVDNRPTMIKFIIKDINLNNDLISDHCVAISAILYLLGEFVDVNIVLPDISIYLAVTKYTGTSYVISECIETIKSRLGGVSYTIAD